MVPHVLKKRTKFNTKLGPHICLCIIAASAVIASAGKPYADRNSQNEELMDRDDFKKVWELYILPKLEFDLRNRLQEIEEINHQNVDEYERFTDLDDSDFSADNREKRLSVAGLDNLDLMTKTLDRAKQFHLPMSVGGMSTNRLRMLMAAAGRRK